LAFIATRTGSDGRAETLDVARTVTDPDNRRAELAILVRPDLKGTGPGKMLMDKIIRYQCERQSGKIAAQVLSDNASVLTLAQKCGFLIYPSTDPKIFECSLRLDSPQDRSAA
jgi:acetyltransferase